MHIFISYHHNDLDFAENVISRLEKEGFSLWADSKLSAGEDWRMIIDLAIKDAFALIVIMTPEAKASEYVTYEWVFAWGVGVKVIPMMLKKTPLHPRLEALQYLDFTNQKSRPWEKLIEEAKNAASRPLAHSVRIPLNAPPFIRQAVTALDSAYSQERISAIETLVQSKGSEVQGVLLEALKHPITDVRVAAAEALGKIGDACAVSALCDVLHDTDASVRAAAGALGKIRDACAVSAICEVLHDGVYADSVRMYVCETAASALCEIGDACAVPALCVALQDERACRAATVAFG